MNKNKPNGNMYNWITDTANPLAGECYHECVYCYVDRLKKMRPAINKKYSGEIRLSENGFKKISGKEKFIFVCDMTDLFAEDVKIDHIISILTKCSQKPENRYLFQTKNPGRLFDNWQLKSGEGIQILDFIPENSVIATTIESNVSHVNYMGNTPHPNLRAEWLSMIDGFEKHITIEPIMRFDLEEFVQILKLAKPTQINIGADTGRNNLPEPTKKEIEGLIEEIRKFSTFKLKDNMKRLF